MSAVLTPQTAAAVPNPLGLPLQALQAGLRRFSVDKYHRMIAVGLLTEDDDVELLDGYLVHKMSRNPPLDGSLLALQDLLTRLLPTGWVCRVESAVVAVRSEPEPDLAVVRGDLRTYFTRHPGPADSGVVIEVADPTLAGDRADKGRIYAEAGLPEYWIVNLVDRQVEVYTHPQPAAAPPAYATRTDYRAGDAVPLTLDGVPVATIPVADVLP
jgi:Uma2 family endonuclease